MIAYRRTFAILTASLLATTSLAARTVQFADARMPADGVLVLPIEQGKPLSGAAAQVNASLSGALERAIKGAAFEGKKKSSLNLYGLGEFGRVTLIGVGDKPLTRTDMEDFGGQIATLLREEKAADVRAVLPGANAEGAAQAALGADLGFYSFDAYRDKKLASVGTLTLLSSARSHC